MATPMAEATQISREAAALGFDWPDVHGPVTKLHEEVAELDEAIAGAHPDEVFEELGDVLFTIVNVARHLGIDPDRAMTAATAKFSRRFHAVRSELGAAFDSSAPDELEAAWTAVKRGET